MKLIREHLNQYYMKFTELGDPIHDMGIGAEPAIRNWLRYMSIYNYKLTKKLSINVYENVDISNVQILKFPDYIKFNHIVGGFHCEKADLTTLRGSPYSVSGSFLVRWNNLKDLSYSPNVVKGSFSVSHNQITSLKGLPDYIGESIFLSHNKLKDLQNIPSIIKGNLYIHDNPLETIDFFPNQVEGNISFSPTPQLTSTMIRKRCKVAGEIIEYTK